MSIREWMQSTQRYIIQCIHKPELIFFTTITTGGGVLFLQENSVVVYEKSDKYQISHKQGQTISTQYHFLMLLFQNDC